MTEQTITKLIGKPEKINFRRPKAIGSAGFYLKSFKSKNTESENLKLDSKCNFENNIISPKYADDVTWISTKKTKVDEVERSAPTKLKEAELEVNKTKTEKYAIPNEERNETMTEHNYIKHHDTDKWTKCKL